MVSFDHGVDQTNVLVSFHYGTLSSVLGDTQEHVTLIAWYYI